jgi:hypothetical protein
MVQSRERSVNDELVRELIELQREQNALLKRHLWRLRFSLMTLLLLSTATAVGLGFLTYRLRSRPIAPGGTITLSGPTTWNASSSRGMLSVRANVGSPQAPATQESPQDNPFE